MPIRKKTNQSDPVVIHRLQVDPKKHPLLHAKLTALGMGSPRTEFIRNIVEAALSGVGGSALISPVHQPVVPEPQGAIKQEDDTRLRRAAAATLIKKNQF